LPPERRFGFAALPNRDFGAVLRGLAVFALTRLAAVLFATFADFSDVLLATTGSFAVAGLLIGPSCRADLRDGRIGFAKRPPFGLSVDQRRQAPSWAL
jgi:hypothetical protein